MECFCSKNNYFLMHLSGSFAQGRRCKSVTTLGDVGLKHDYLNHMAVFLHVVKQQAQPLPKIAGSPCIDVPSGNLNLDGCMHTKSNSQMITPNEQETLVCHMNSNTFCTTSEAWMGADHCEWIIDNICIYIYIYICFNVHKKKRRPTRLFPNQPRVANYARSRKEGGEEMGVDGVKGGSCPLEVPAKLKPGE